MKFLSYFILALLLTIVASCNRTSQLSENNTIRDYSDTHTLEIVDTLEILVDSMTECRTLFLRHIDTDSIEYLAYGNRTKPSIQLYGLHDQNLYHETLLKRKGPNGVGKLKGFFLHSLDTLFTTDGIWLRLYLVDRAGKVLQRYNLRSLIEYPKSAPDGITSLPMYYDAKKGKLTVACHPQSDYSKPGLWDGDIALEVDVKSNIAKYIYYGPEEYHNNLYGAFFSHHSVTMNDEGLYVYSFPFDPQIFVTDRDTKYEKYYAGSKYFDLVPEYDPSSNVSAEQFYIESYSFEDLLYDKWRKVYYRVATRPIKYIDDEGNRNTWHDKNKSIIILNKEYKKIGEVDLPVRTYYMRDNMFVGRKGLYISNNHDSNPILDENKLSFSIFELKAL